MQLYILSSFNHSWKDSPFFSYPEVQEERL